MMPSTDFIGSTPAEDQVFDNTQITTKAILNTQHQKLSKIKSLRKEIKRRLIQFPIICQQWRSASLNYIEVALKAVDGSPHLYHIDNKLCKLNSITGQHDLIVKDEEKNLLYYQVTEEDYAKGYKTFQVELMKLLQKDQITKDVIRQRQLDKSRLAFTRCYIDQFGQRVRDQNTTVLSNVMAEAYGAVDVVVYGPTYGKYQGGELIFILLKGRVLRQGLTIVFTENRTGWYCPIQRFEKNGNCIYFNAPAYYQLLGTAKVNIVVSYQGVEVEQLPYTYDQTLDAPFVNMNTIQDHRSTLMFEANCSKNADKLEQNFSFLQS
ncbi:unnamed protein product [Didymodactylos carnosus]|uniref:Uncharacterized protein n=1 Tax=Didymodactylos carnosus TaxID=1234261 RepID=A0A8S2SUA5_9BILA|nr:unnamed protein product [Didymodactylos carnosus]CAF4244370.1 unnamed protein product [Didymodactylos carnosus]